MGLTHKFAALGLLLTMTSISANENAKTWGAYIHMVTPIKVRMPWFLFLLPKRKVIRFSS